MRVPLLWLAALMVLIPGRDLAAQDAASAKAFLQSVYQRYENHGKGTDFSSRYYHSSILKLIRNDRNVAGQNVPACCDGDPICSCEELDGIWDLKIDVRMEQPDGAEAGVNFAIFGPKNRTKDDLRTIKITLVPEQGQWRIYDIVDESDPSHPSDFRKEIQDDIDSYAKHPEGR